MSELIYVPLSLMRMQAQGLELTSRVISPGLTGAGVLPMVSTDGGGLWRYDLTSIQLYEPNHKRAWRAIAGACDGGVNKLIVSLYDNEHQPWPIVDGVPFTSYDPIPHDDDSYFDDGTGYYQNVIDAQTVGTAALRATSLTVAFAYGGPLVGGEHFSIDHPTMRHRIYRVVRVTENDDGDSVVTIRPPLREAVAAATPLDFDHPKGIFQPASPDALDIVTDINQVARPSPTLIEAFTPEMLA